MFQSTSTTQRSRGVSSPSTWRIKEPVCDPKRGDPRLELWKAKENFLDCLHLKWGTHGWEAPPSDPIPPSSPAPVRTFAPYPRRSTSCHFPNHSFLIWLTVNSFQVLRDKVTKQIFFQTKQTQLLSYRGISTSLSSCCLYILSLHSASEDPTETLQACFVSIPKEPTVSPPHPPRHLQKLLPRTGTSSFTPHLSNSTLLLLPSPTPSSLSALP